MWFQIVDAETGRTMTAANQDGEITVKTPGLFTGYWNNPDATGNSVDSQGWLKTGRQTESILSFAVLQKYSILRLGFYPRDAMLARVFATATCPSVCLSVCLSHAGIVPSRAKAGS